MVVGRLIRVLYVRGERWGEQERRVSRRGSEAVRQWAGRWGRQAVLLLLHHHHHHPAKVHTRLGLLCVWLTLCLALISSSSSPQWWELLYWLLYCCLLLKLPGVLASILSRKPPPPPPASRQVQAGKGKKANVPCTNGWREGMGRDGDPVRPVPCPEGCCSACPLPRSSSSSFLLKVGE